MPLGRRRSDKLVARGSRNFPLGGGPQVGGAVMCFWHLLGRGRGIGSAPGNGLLASTAVVPASRRQKVLARSRARSQGVAPTSWPYQMHAHTHALDVRVAPRCQGLL